MGTSHSREDEVGGDEGSRPGDTNSRMAKSISSETCMANKGLSSTLDRIPLRMIIPKRRQKQSLKGLATVSSNKLSSSATSPIVASFKTNLAGKFNNPGSTDSGLYVSKTRASNDEDTYTNGTSNWSMNKRTSSKRLTAILDIPSPVPSVSEPSEDNISLLEPGPTVLENDVPTKQDIRTSPALSIIRSSNTNGDSTGRSEKKISMISNGKIPKAVSENEKIAVTPKFVAEGVNFSTTPTKRMASMNMEENQLKRPTTLSPYLSGSHSAWTKLSGIAPLAESESFVIENSPAVEIIPRWNDQCQLGGMPTLSMAELNKCDHDKGLVKPKDGGNSEYYHYQAGSRISRLQSRLKNPDIYSNRQHNIYNRNLPLSVSNLDLERSKKNDLQQGTSSATASETWKFDTASPGTNFQEPAMRSPCTRNLLNPGDMQKSSRRNDSPEASPHRGLIDDEIRDQPDLTIDCHSLGNTSMEGRSRSSTLKSETFKDVPVRHRRRGTRRYLRYLTNEPYESTTSSVSMDSDDLMLDFEENRMHNAISNYGNSSSLERRRSGNETGCVGSLERRKAKTMTTECADSSVKRVINEWSSLRDNFGNQCHAKVQPEYPVPDQQLTGPASSSVQGNNVGGNSSLLSEFEAIDSIGLEQQIYRHAIQDITVMKTLLLRLKRVLQDTETPNPPEISATYLNGLTKAVPVESETHVNLQMDNVTLKKENRMLKGQVALLSQELADQGRVIQCLQQQLKQRRQRNVWNFSCAEETCESDAPIERSSTVNGPTFHVAQRTL